MTLALGLQTRERHEKVWAKSATWYHIHTFESAKKCEGMNPHTPNFGVKVSMDS
jgi:hypothetical protein